MLRMRCALCPFVFPGTTKQTLARPDSSDCKYGDGNAWPSCVQVTTMLTSTYLASMATPLVCRLHGVAWHDDEVWIVMELCEGTAMDAVMRARADDKSLEGLPPPDLLILGIEVAEALAALHERARTLHLDLKPENVLLTAEHKVRLSDFGVSRRLPTRITAKTMTGISAGTPGYASPEQMLHRRGTARSDVYSLGASIIYFASGVHPYEGCADMAYIAAQLATGRPMPVPENLLPEQLRSLVQRMVRIDEDKRPTLYQVCATFDVSTHHAEHFPCMPASLGCQASPSDSAMTP